MAFCSSVSVLTNASARAYAASHASEKSGTTCGPELHTSGGYSGEVSGNVGGTGVAEATGYDVNWYEESDHVCQPAD